MPTHSPTLIVFYAFGFVLGYTAAAVFLLSLAALLVRHRRRALVTSISTLSWIIIATGAVVGMAYIAELSIAWFGANQFERFTFFRVRLGLDAHFNWYSCFYWLMTISGVLAPQLYWFRRCRTNAWLSLAVCALILLPGNFERLVIYLTSESDFLPASWKH